jgi:hypothetical protein
MGKEYIHCLFTASSNRGLKLCLLSGVLDGAISGVGPAFLPCRFKLYCVLLSHAYGVRSYLHCT